MARRPSMSGGGTFTLRVYRPGRRMALSSVSRWFVAAMTTAAHEQHTSTRTPTRMKITSSDDAVLPHPGNRSTRMAFFALLAEGRSFGHAGRDEQMSVAQCATAHAASHAIWTCPAVELDGALPVVEVSNCITRCIAVLGMRVVSWTHWVPSIHMSTRVPGTHSTVYVCHACQFVPEGLK